MRGPREVPALNSIDYPGASTAPLTQISWGARKPTESPEASQKPQLGSKTHVRATGGSTAAQPSLACFEAITRVQTLGRYPPLAPLPVASSRWFALRSFSAPRERTLSSQCQMIPCQRPVSEAANTISVPVMTAHRGVAAIYIVACISPIEVRHSTDIPAEPRRLSGSAGVPLRIPNAQ